MSALYVHFPFCVHLCNYCDFYKQKLKSASSVAEFESRLQKDWSEVQKLASSENKTIEEKIDTLYLGGGTPSLWEREGALFFDSFLSANGIGLAPECEFTIEADPGAWSDEGISAWQSIGVNRFSVGVQAFDDEFLKVMDRRHDKGEAEKTLRYFKDRELSFSADLMLGLPYSQKKKRNVLEELDKMLSYGPDHLSVYILKTRSNYPHNEALPGDTYIENEYLKVSEFLRENGLNHYEVSNFARPGKRSRHNMKYWQAKDVHAIGPNATGFMRTQTGAVRYQHKVSSGPLTLEQLDQEALLLERVYLGLRTDQGLDLQRLLPNNAPALRELAGQWNRANYLLKADIDRLVLSPRGYLMIDSLVDDLFKRNLL